MRRHTVRIHSAALDPFGEPTVRVLPAPATRLVPGAAVLVGLPGQPLLRQVFPSAIENDSLSLLLDPEPGAFPGEHLDLFTLSGRGFDPPATARRWLLYTSRPTPSRLMPLVQAGTARGAELVLASSRPLVGLPPSVEVVTSLELALPWADYVAGDADLSDLGPDFLAINLPPIPAEILISSPMPCGFGGCGACALPGSRATRLLCRDGPVIDLRRILPRRIPA